MRLLTLISAILFVSFAFNVSAQRAIEVFNNDGDAFFIYLNGEKQNKEAQTRVTLYDLKSEWYKGKIVFQKNGIPEIEKNLMTKPGKKVTYTIKKNRKGAYKLRFFSEMEFERSAAKKETKPQKTTVSTSTAAPQKNRTTETHTVQTTTTTSPEKTNENVNISINTQMNEQGATVNVSGGETTESETVKVTTTTEGNPQKKSNNAQMTFSSTTTTTTTSSSSSSSTNFTEQPVQKREATRGCMMSATAFEKAKKSIAGKTFEDSKMTMAKQITKSHCLTATQIKEVMELLEYESTRVEYAQFAYPKCQNKNEYYIVNDAFEYESSIDELNEFIDAQ
ncbi:DUF4476 domain-containing protein [Salinivirga cyanobacteriivorans]